MEDTNTAGSKIIYCGKCGMQIFPGYVHGCTPTSPQQYTLPRHDEILQRLDKLEELLKRLISMCK